MSVAQFSLLRRLYLTYPGAAALSLFPLPLHASALLDILYTDPQRQPTRLWFASGPKSWATLTVSRWIVSTRALSQLVRLFIQLVTCRILTRLFTLDQWFQSDPQFIKDMEPMINETPAAPRVGEVDDIAPLVAFLCSDDARWTTGSCLCANGGLYN